MPTNELGVEWPGQRVVDLQADNRFDALAGKPVEAASGSQRGEHAAVSIGGNRNMIRSIEQEQSVLGIDCRQRALLKQQHLVGVEATELMLVEKITGGGVSGNAGHDRQGNSPAIPPLDCLEVAQQQFKQRRP